MGAEFGAQRRFVLGHAFAVQRLVVQPIGMLVLGAANVADVDCGKTLAQLARLAVQFAQVGVFDLILAVHLLHHQLAVALDQKPVVWSEEQCVFQRANETDVFCLVIGHLAEATRFLDLRSVRQINHIGKRGRPGIAAGAAVGVDGEQGGVFHDLPREGMGRRQAL
jgi:hypothetical protein